MVDIKVSVIIPVYNVERYLKRCLDSVINQTLKDIEIICIDDNSSDNSPNILVQYLNVDSRIKLIKNPQNMGTAFSRNSGLNIAHGIYVIFIDSDDYIDLDTLEKYFNIAKDNCLDLVSFSSLNPQNLEKKCITGIEVLKEYIKNRPVFSVCCCLYKRSYLAETKIFFDDDIRYAEDHLFSLKVFSNALRCMIYNDNKYHIVAHSDSLSRSYLSRNKLIGALNALNRMLLFEPNIYDSHYKLLAFRLVLSTYECILDELYSDDNYNKLNENEKAIYDILLFSKYPKHNAWKDLANCKKRLYFYGAGMRAKEYILLLDEMHIDLLGIILTSMPTEYNKLMGYPIQSIDQFNYDKENDLIIIASVERNMKEIRDTLEQRNIYNYIWFDESELKMKSREELIML